MKFFSLKQVAFLFSLIFALCGGHCLVHAATPSKLKIVKPLKPAVINKKTVSQPAKITKTRPNTITKNTTVNKKIVKPNTTTAKAQVLFEKFVDLKSNLPWKCFSKQLASTLASEPKYRPLVSELKKLTMETDALKIGLRIRTYKYLLTPETNKLLQKYNVQQMRTILEKRIAQNKNAQC